MARNTVAVTIDAETYDRIAAREGSEAAVEAWIRDAIERRLAADDVAANDDVAADRDGETDGGDPEPPTGFVDDCGI